MNKNQVKQRILIVFSVLAIISGSWILLSSPGRQAEKSLNIAKNSLVHTQNELIEFETYFKPFNDWYKESYTEAIIKRFDFCQEMMIQAQDEIESAKSSSSSKVKRTHADKAQELMVNITDDMTGIYNSLSGYDDNKNIARQQFGELNQYLERMTTERELAEKRFLDESSKYLAKYEQLNKNILVEAQKIFAETLNSVQLISEALPIDAIANRSGDPDLAINLSQTANDNLDLVDLANKQIIYNFDFYLEAENNAASSAVLAKQNIATATNYLNSVVSRGPLQPDKALKVAFDELTEAGQKLTESQAALKEITAENKYDFPLAYSSAAEALKLANASVQEADNQVALLNKVSSDYKQFKLAINSLAQNINGARSDQAKLSNHDRSTWSEVADNINSATQRCESAKELLLDIERLVAVDQSYQAAIELMNNDFQSMKQGDVLVATLIMVVDELESYRSNWPDAENKAKWIISNEEDYIDSYGGYDSSAQFDFDSAVSKLASARSFANSRDYQSAVEYANAAARLADGTGDEAKQAYDDEQARKKAADDISFSSDSSDDSSWGGSSDSWGGSSSSSDGGSWSGSSSSSDGGSWGGSSSSSDGGDW